MLVTQSCLTLATSWTVAHQAPLSMEFSRQEYWRGLPFPSPGDLPNPRIKPGSPHSRWILYRLRHQGSYRVKENHKTGKLRILPLQPNKKTPLDCAIVTVDKRFLWIMLWVNKNSLIKPRLQMCSPMFTFESSIIVYF